MKFGKVSFAEELEAGMAQFEQKLAIPEEEKQEVALVTAMEELNAAAVAYEEAGLVSQASAVTALMVVLAKKGKPEKEPKKPAKKDDKNNLTKDEKKVFEMFGFGKGKKNKDKKPSKDGK